MGLFKPRGRSAQSMTAYVRAINAKHEASGVKNGDPKKPAAKKAEAEKRKDEEIREHGEGEQLQPDITESKT